MAHRFARSRLALPAFLTIFDVGNGTVRFDFAGCGDSEDAPVTDAGMIADLRTVLGSGEGMGLPADHALHGHSHGGSVCLRAA